MNPVNNQQFPKFMKLPTTLKKDILNRDQPNLASFFSVSKAFKSLSEYLVDWIKLAGKFNIDLNLKNIPDILERINFINRSVDDNSFSNYKQPKGNVIQKYENFEKYFFSHLEEMHNAIREKFLNKEIIFDDSTYGSQSITDLCRMLLKSGYFAGQPERYTNYIEHFFIAFYRYSLCDKPDLVKNLEDLAKIFIREFLADEKIPSKIKSEVILKLLEARNIEVKTEHSFTHSYDAWHIAEYFVPVIMGPHSPFSGKEKYDLMQQIIDKEMNECIFDYNISNISYLLKSLARPSDKAIKELLKKCLDYPNLESFFTLQMLIKFSSPEKRNSIDAMIKEILASLDSNEKTAENLKKVKAIISGQSMFAEFTPENYAKIKNSEDNSLFDNLKSFISEEVIFEYMTPQDKQNIFNLLDDFESEEKYHLLNRLREEQERSNKEHQQRISFCASHGYKYVSNFDPIHEADSFLEIINHNSMLIHNKYARIRDLLKAK